MSVLALHHHADELGVRRYGAAAFAIVLLHLAVIAAALPWYKRAEPVGVSPQPILVELAPAPAAPKLQTEDLLPGPQMQLAETPPPEPQKLEKIEEQLPPTPAQPEPVVAAPPKIEPEPAPAPVKPQPVKEVKRPAKQLVQPSTTARVARVAPDSPAPTQGRSAAAAAASYLAILAAHIERFKQAPNDQRKGEYGQVSIDITVTRNGRVSSSRLVRSSGFASLDREALAMIQRAQPMPSFPPEVRDQSLSYLVPVTYRDR